MDAQLRPNQFAATPPSLPVEFPFPIPLSVDQIAAFSLPPLIDRSQHPPSGPPTLSATAPMKPEGPPAQLNLVVPETVVYQASRSTTVRRAIVAVLGVDPSQKELLAFRNEVFNGVMPSATRCEKRQRQLNLAAFERYRQAIVPMLGRSDVCAKILNISLKLRALGDQEKILMHLFV